VYTVGAAEDRQLWRSVRPLWMRDKEIPTLAPNITNSQVTTYKISVRHR